MKKIKIVNIIGLIVATIFFNSCEFDIDYNANLPQDKFVVSSFIEADSTISFYVFHSAKPGVFEGDNEENNFKSNINNALIKDASCTLIVNGEEKQTLNSVNPLDNKYTFSYIPKKDDKILIKINKDGYLQASGESLLSLNEPNVDSVSCYLEKQHSDGEEELRFVLYFEIKDDGKADNYYKITPQIKLYDNGSYVNDVKISDASVVYESHQGVYQENNISFNDATNNFGVFSNKKFKGQTYKLKLSFYAMSYGKGNMMKTIDRAKGNLFISKIDKQSFDYLSTLSNYKNNSGMNTNPVIISSSIVNGYGFIGAKKTIIIKNLNTTLNNKNARKEK